MIHIIYSEYDRDLSLDMVADRLHYNPNYLSNVFKKETGENFGDFIQNYRLEIAKKWLKETTLSVKEIAERLKYRNSQNFIRFFKKKESVTPGEYRKKNRWGQLSERRSLKSYISYLGKIVVSIARNSTIFEKWIFLRSCYLNE